MALETKKEILAELRRVRKMLEEERANNRNIGRANTELSHDIHELKRENEKISLNLTTYHHEAISYRGRAEAFEEALEMVTNTSEQRARALKTKRTYTG
jgi:hypothetical protein